MVPVYTISQSILLTRTSEASLELIQTATMIIQSSFLSNKIGKKNSYAELEFNDVTWGPVSVGGAIVAIRSVINI